MSNFKEVKEPIEKVLKKISTNPELINKGKGISIENFYSAVCDHLLTDVWERYGLKRKEVQQIREYFHEDGTEEGREPFDFVMDLNKNFKEYFTIPEREFFINSANEYRKSKGLGPIILK